MKVKVLSKAGAETGREIELSDDIFGIEPMITLYIWLLSHFWPLNVRVPQIQGKVGVSALPRKPSAKRYGGARRGSMKAPV